MLCTSRASCMGPFAHRPLRSLQETKPISARSAGWGRQALLPPQTPCSPHPLWPTSARWHRLGTHRWRTSTPNCCEVKADAGQISGPGCDHPPGGGRLSTVSGHRRGAGSPGALEAPDGAGACARRPAGTGGGPGHQLPVRGPGQSSDDGQGCGRPPRCGGHDVVSLGPLMTLFSAEGRRAIDAQNFIRARGYGDCRRSDPWLGAPDEKRHE